MKLEKIYRQTDCPYIKVVYEGGLNMDVGSVSNGNGLQYEPKTASEKKDKEKLANSPNKKELGVIVEISKESEEA